MDPARFGKLSELFESARTLAPPERASFLDDACSGDEDLRTSIDALLAQHDSESPLDGTAPEFTPHVAAATLEETPDSIGSYQIVQEVGRGGMGVVYEALQDDPKRRVAMKIIKLGMDTREVIARFETERHALARMDHPNIAHVYGAGATDTGRPFFVMEYVEGVPITRACEDRTLDVRARLGLFIRVCQAIQHAHQKGVIHRDIKPSNILVTELDGELVPKVIDFGIAKATDSDTASRTLATLHGQVIGTPAYMSPEQADMNSSDVDTRSDIYSLGVLLYEILTGYTPFDREELDSKGFSEMIRIIREDEPRRPSDRLDPEQPGGRYPAHERSRARTMLRRDIDWVVMKCLEKDRAARYESAGELASDIERLLADEPTLAGPRTTAYKLQKFVRRNKGRVVAAALVTLTLTLGVIGTSAGLIVAIDERDRARELAISEATAREQAQVNAQRAEIEAETAEATLAFLLDDLLGAADPARTDSRDITVREAVTLAAETIDEQFKERPVIEARIRNTIGTVLTQLGQFDEAEPHIRAELSLIEQGSGPDSLETISAMTALASNLMHQSRFTDAIELTQDQLERLSRVSYEQKDTLRLQALGNLGVAHLQLGQYNEAAPILEKTLIAKRGLLGDRDDSTLSSIHNLAGLYGSLGDYDRALELAREAYAGRLDVLGPGDPRTFGSLNVTAWILRMAERFEESDAFLTKAISDAHDRLGPEHRSTISLSKTLALQLLQQEQYERAETMFRDLIAIQRKQDPGLSNVNTISTRVNLARTLIETDGTDEAVHIMSEILPAARKVYPPDSSELVSVLLLAGRAHSENHNFDTADGLLLEAHRILDAGAKRRSGAVADLYMWTADHYQRWHAAEPGQGYDGKSKLWREYIKQHQQ